MVLSKSHGQFDTHAITVSMTGFHNESTVENKKKIKKNKTKNFLGGLQREGLVECYIR
jgi:hypothetical protein